MIRYGIRQLYNVEIKHDFSNIITLYDFNNQLCKLGILDDDIYIPIYRKYDTNDINDELVTLILQCSKYLTDTLITEAKNKTVTFLALEYFENYNIGYLNLLYGVEYPPYELLNQVSSFTSIVNCTNKIPLSQYLKEKLITFLFSIEKDSLSNSYEIFSLIIEKISFIIKSTDWNKKLNTSTNFFILENIVHN